MRLPMNTSLATLKPSGIRRINALAAQYPGCIALALGEPDFSTPDVISAEVNASLDRGDTHYPPNNGRPALREALSAYMGDAGLTFSADEVILTDGATEALSATFMAMLNPHVGRQRFAQSGATVVGRIVRVAAVQRSVQDVYKRQA